MPDAGYDWPMLCQFAGGKLKSARTGFPCSHQAVWGQYRHLVGSAHALTVHRARQPWLGRGGILGSRNVLDEDI